MNNFLPKTITSLFLLLFCCTTLLLAQNNSSKKNKPNKDGNYTIVEEMPRFPGCEDIEGDFQEKKSCADQKLLRFIYQNIKYPREAHLQGKQGMAVISFIVTTEGKLRDIEILRDPGAGMGEEAARVIGLMNTMEERWTPGTQRGKAVPVKYNIPIRFALNTPQKPKDDTEEKESRI